MIFGVHSRRTQTGGLLPKVKKWIYDVSNFELMSQVEMLED